MLLDLLALLVKPEILVLPVLPVLLVLLVLLDLPVLLV